MPTYEPKTRPDGTNGAVQYAFGNQFAASSSVFYWDSVNNRLGIGTSTPAVALDVNGDITCNTLNYTTLNPPIASGITIGDAITSGTAQRILFEDVSNNLAQVAGFTFDGTDSLSIPSGGCYQIAGVNVICVAGTNNLWLGRNLLYNSSGQTSSVYVGDTIGNATATGDRNVFIGYLLGANLTTGHDNFCAVGAGPLITSGEDNVCIGDFNCGSVINTGSGNVLLGSNSGNSISSGNNNFCLGNSTLATISNQSGNVGIGYQALRYTRQAECVGIGVEAGRGHATGTHGIYIGYRAGWGNGSQYTNANNNVGIGALALYKIGNSSADNTCIGNRASTNYLTSCIGNTIVGVQANYSAGGSITYNTYIGWKAGRDATSSLGIFIGANAGYHNATNNRLIIDNRNRSNAATEVTNSIIHGDMAATTAGQELRLNANIKIAEVIKVKERAAAAADTAGYGQLWIKNTTPCELWFTDDAGTDTQIV